MIPILEVEGGIYIYIYCLAFDCIAIVESGRATSKGR